MLDVSIVLCCYNSASRIKPTLEHIANQELNGLSCEIILVDNNCSDDTVKVALEIWNQCDSPFQLSIITENKSGLSNARKAGVLSSKGKLIVFCDDDNWLDRNYISKAFIIAESNLKIGILGGRGIPVTDVPLPHWFSTYSVNYATGVLDINTGDITSRGWIWGAGMVVRRSILLRLYRLGIESVATDRVKDKLTSSGDVELCYWVFLSGYKLWYNEDLVFKHYLPSIRLTKEYLIKLVSSQRASQSSLNVYQPHITAKRQLNNKRSIYIEFINSIICNLKGKDLRLFYIFPALSFLLNKFDRELVRKVNRMSFMTNV